MHLVLSPHPDDAPLSLGGLIYQLSASGESVRILTTMSGDPRPPIVDTPLVRELHARWELGAKASAARRLEDEAAAQVLGARITFLETPDCIYRVGPDGAGLYPTVDAIFGDPNAADSVFSHMPQVLIDALADTTDVYAPLAVGNHVDHQAAKQWAIAVPFLRPGLRVWLYEDYPYAEQPAAVDAALAATPGSLSLKSFQLSARDMRAKMDAVACYASQISTFWSSLTEMETRLTAYFTRGGTLPPHERCWAYEGFWG